MIFRKLILAIQDLRTEVTALRQQIVRLDRKLVDPITYWDNPFDDIDLDINPLPEIEKE